MVCGPDYRVLGQNQVSGQREQKTHEVITEKPEKPGSGVKTLAGHRTDDRLKGEMKKIVSGW